MVGKLLLPVILLAMPCGAMASTVSIGSSSAGPSYISKNGIREDTVTRGRDLTGMILTASYVDGTAETVIWNETRSPTSTSAWGDAIGSGFSMLFGWSAFELSVSKSLASLSMDARTGNAIFDIDPSTKAGDSTYGTKNGYPFEVVGTHEQAGNIDVTYSSQFYVAGQARAEDAYTYMEIDFTGLEGGGLIGPLDFRTDLDSLAVAGDFAAVPLPAPLLLFASALGMLGVGTTRKKQSTR